MTYSRLLDFLRYFHFFFIGLGIISVFWILFVYLRENFNSGKDKEELTKEDRETPGEPLKTLTQQQLLELLCHLEEEKEIVFFGFEKMNPEQKEAAIVKNAHLEQMIQKADEVFYSKIEDKRRITVKADSIG